MNRSRTTIYNELKRGSVEQIKNGRKIIVYYPDAGQAQYKRNNVDFMESKTKVSKVFKTMTSDNGSEFSGLSDIESLVSIYFCHPYSSFERGSNERHNGILRQFFPKGRSINDFSEDEIMYYVDLINAKPRKILGYKTPEEIFDEEMDKIYSRVLWLKV